MKNTVFIISLLIFCTACTSEPPQPQNDNPVNKKIEVEFNPNIHTSHVIELFVWPGEYPTRPMVVAAQNYFAPYQNHPAIQLSDSLLQNEIFYFDELTEILLYLEPFPSTAFKYPLENSPYADRVDVINEWIRLIADFYVEAKGDKFLAENQAFYQGAKEEVLKNLPPDDFVQQIESYYRNSKIKYTIIPAPEMPTGGAYGQRGIGPYIYAPDGMLIYQVISASLPVEKDSATNTYRNYGFDNEEFTLRNSYHEFGHAFVNPVLDKEKNKSLLDQYEHLFIPELKEVMEKQNYGNWFDCMAEHLVRLGEIRLAERSGYKKWAEELREKHTQQLNFIFLPELEQKIRVYEQDEKYDSFEAFLPELLGVLASFDDVIIKNRIEENK